MATEMKKAAHTPGPWTYAGEDEDGDIPIKGETGTLGKTIAYLTGIHNYEANGHLIKAAPDLLAACDDLYELSRAYAEQRPVSTSNAMATWERARAAIAKARGTA